MQTTITSILSTYGFEDRAARTMFWGEGSLVWGHTLTVRAMGADLYEVTIAHWYYDQYGDPVRDTKETRILHGAAALEWVFKEAPASFWRGR